MNVICLNCKRQFNLDSTQIELVEKLKSRAASLVMLNCRLCKQTFPANPQNLEGEMNTRQELTWRSPISGCHGYVSFIEDDQKTFYGCGESGEVWFSEESFFKSIEASISKYEYRAQLYEKRGDKWYPSANEPEGIDELIDKEGID